MSDHGYGRYANGCRCDECRTAKADYMRERRAAGRVAAHRFDAMPGRYVAPIARHGTRYGYEEAGCRCLECTAARAESDARYRKAATS